MGDVEIMHPETGGKAVVPQEALDHHLRQSGWMTPAELEEHQARLAEREQAAGTAAKATVKGKTESEGK